MSTPTSSIAPASDALIKQIGKHLRNYGLLEECGDKTCDRCLAIEAVHDHAEAWLSALLARITQVEQELKDAKVSAFTSERFRSEDAADHLGDMIPLMNRMRSAESTLQTKEAQWAERIAQVRAMRERWVCYQKGRGLPALPSDVLNEVLSLLTQEP